MKKAIIVMVEVIVDTPSGYVNTLAIGEAVKDAVRQKDADEGLTSEDDDAITKSIEVYVV